MTKKIFSSIMLTAACVLLASMITTVGFLRDYFGGIEESGLREELGIAAVGVEDDGMDYLAALPDGQRRFTWIAADGSAIYDTKADADSMENHSEREEVKAAFETGAGESVRYSNTLMQKTMYAARRLDDGTVQLLKGSDPGKDQSYFLHRLSQEQVSRAIFPVGGMMKTEVRAIAKKIGLPVAEKKDSTGICFIGERPFREFLERYLPTKEGEIRTPDGTPEGRVIGKHIGLAFYTIGQRKGIGIGGCRDSEEKPWFVAKKDIRTNTLWVVQGHDPWLLGDHLFADSPSWISGHAPEAGSKLGVKTRYRQADCPATLASVDGEQFAVKFDEPQWAVTPGQSAVLYDGEVCLGGGFIEGLSNGQAR